MSLDALGSATLFSKASPTALGPSMEEKQVMLQLAVTIRSCRGSLCCGTVHGQVALTCSSHPVHTRQSFAMWQDTGLRCPCARILWVATAFGPLFNNLLHSGHVLCSTVNATGALDRSMFLHPSASSPKSSLRSSHQLSVLALASIVFHLPGRKIMSNTHAGQSSKGLQDRLPVQIRWWK